ncbi:hypothetical protein ABZ465_04555 [Streptomyces griseoincarnatus]
MSTVAFVNVALRGHINPTLPVVAELVRRGHTVTYHTTAAFEPDVAAAGTTVFRYPGDGPPLAGPPTPVTLLEQLARTALETLPSVLSDLRLARPDVVVHGAACPWGPVTAAELGVPAVSLFTPWRSAAGCPAPPAPPGPCWPRRSRVPAASSATSARACCSPAGTAPGGCPSSTW